MSVKRHIGQQVALATAAFCALLALPAFGLFLWLWKERGLADTWTPSALAAVAFLFTHETYSLRKPGSGKTRTVAG